MELGIKGHKTRGEEIIKILKMLGGKNPCNLTGDNDKYFYYIGDKYIYNSYIGSDETEGYIIFTLEDFLEKIPYKVGDKVTLDNKLCSIIWMFWECNNIYYLVQGTDTMFTKKVIANELKPYKGKNTNMNIEYDLAKYSYEIKDGKIVIGEKKPKYPTDFDECIAILHLQDSMVEARCGYECNLINYFQRLLMCRDAYWKIAGEQMGLDKPWEPDWTNNYQKKWLINFYQGEINFTTGPNVQFILAFPTVEMRDAFYENFKDLIEDCKELL